LDHSNHISVESKATLLRLCHQWLDKKIAIIKKELDNITEAANNETKSTAGDKHETARAMMQIEQEKLGKQISSLEQERSLLLKIKPEVNKHFGSGSLVETDHGLFFIALPLGKIEMEGQVVFVVSPLSPFGKGLIACKNNSFEINSKTYLIKNSI
jgi:hypothetical protein